MSYSVKIEPNSKVSLKKIDSREDRGLSKPEGQDLAEKLGQELSELQDLLFSAGETSCVVVLQGMDTSGKDGMIRCLAKYVNIQSCRVASFKTPTEEELAHDFLWRVHAQTPRKGEIVVFNRSHYEDVLIAKVHDLAPKDAIRKRYDLINDFERNLVENGTIVLKFFLHISKAEQEERLLDREKDPTKAWKLAVSDWKERELWDSYQEAYEIALEKCSTDVAPWHVVPADHKWFRDIAVLEQIVKALRPFRQEWLDRLDKIGKAAREELMNYR